MISKAIYKLIFGTLIFFIAMSCNSEEESYSRNPFPGIISEKQKVLQTTFKEILRDTDKLSGNGRSLDLFILDTINQVGVDCFTLSNQGVNFKVSLGDTIILKDQKIKFKSSSNTISFELFDGTSDDFRFMEFALFQNNEAVNCCTYSTVKYIDTLTNKIQFYFEENLSIHSIE